MTYKSSGYRSFKIYSQGCGLKRNTINSPQNLCYHKFSKGISVSSHRFDERGFILQIIIVLPAQIIPVNVQLTSQLMLCNSGLGWKKKKKKRVPPNATKYRTTWWLKLEFGHKILFTILKITKFATFSGSSSWNELQAQSVLSDNMVPRISCWFSTKSDKGQWFVTTAECAFYPWACWFVLCMQSQFGTVEIYRSHCFLQEKKVSLCLFTG